MHILLAHTMTVLMPTHMPTHFSAQMSTHMFTHMSIHMSTHMFTHMSTDNQCKRGQSMQQTYHEVCLVRVSLGHCLDLLAKAAQFRPLTATAESLPLPLSVRACVHVCMHACVHVCMCACVRVCVILVPSLRMAEPYWSLVIAKDGRAILVIRHR